MQKTHCGDVTPTPTPPEATGALPVPGIKRETHTAHVLPGRTGPLLSAH